MLPKRNHYACTVLLILTLCPFTLLAQSAGDPASQSSDPNSGQTGGPPLHRPGPPPSPQQELGRLTRDLNLSAEQQAAVLEILQKRQTAMQALSGSSADRAAEREQRHTIMESSQAEIRAQLTAAQIATLKSMRPPHRGGGGPPPGSPPDGADAPPPPPDGSSPQ